MSEDRLLDVNVLLALTQASHVMNDAAHRWLTGVLEARGTWGTCSLTEAAFLRITTNPAFAGRQIGVRDALATLDRLREGRSHRFYADPTSLAASRLDLAALVGPKQVTDFHLVNLAASSNAVLATFDSRLLDALAPADRRHVELIPA